MILSQYNGAAIQPMPKHNQGWEKATHSIGVTNHDGSSDRILVRLDPDAHGDGPLYTREEWDSGLPADWELVDGEARFQGGVPSWCRSYSIIKLGGS